MRDIAPASRQARTLAASRLFGSITPAASNSSSIRAVALIEQSRAPAASDRLAPAPHATPPTGRQRPRPDAENFGGGGSTCNPLPLPITPSPPRGAGCDTVRHPDPAPCAVLEWRALRNCVGTGTA